MLVIRCNFFYLVVDLARLSPITEMKIRGIKFIQRLPWSLSNNVYEMTSYKKWEC